MKIPLFGIYVKYKTDDMIWTPYNTDFEYVVTEEPTLKNISFESVKKKLIPFWRNILMQNQYLIVNDFPVINPAFLIITAGKNGCKDNIPTGQKFLSSILMQWAMS
jgi:hypothetical protein